MLLPARRYVVRLCGGALLCALSSHVTAQGLTELFTDPVDGRFDASQWLLERRGFLPVPLVITEPAVGYGGGIALAFFHRDESSSPPQQERTKEFIPPSVSVVLGAATENGTKIAGVGHLGVWRDNTVRYTGGVAAIDVNLTFYGGTVLPRLDDGVEYNLKGWGTLQQVIWRIGRSDFWVGPQVLYLDVDTGLDEPNPPAAAGQLVGAIDNLGAGVVLQYDSRDNIFTPSTGLQAEWYFREHWGTFVNDFQYSEIDARNRWYFQPAKPWVIGWRLDASFVSDETPFYALPFINQRGIPKMRYQGEAMAATEVETRYAFDARWFGVAFAGVGRVADSFSGLGSDDDRWAGGAGVRYLVSRVLGLQVGVDVAKGPEEWAFYLQAGSGWGF